MLVIQTAPTQIQDVQLLSKCSFANFCSHLFSARLYLPHHIMRNTTLHHDVLTVTYGSLVVVMRRPAQGESSWAQEDS